MPDVLRFGIHSLDELLGIPDTLKGKKKPFGISLQRTRASGSKAKAYTTSVCVVGPNGTGKSIFALHMASTYLADCMATTPRLLPIVLYVSTDFTFNMAHTVWHDFALNLPFSRKDPFGPVGIKPPQYREREIELDNCFPTAIAEEFDRIENEKQRVVFVDLASYTAGDDWGFLHKLLSLLPSPTSPKAPRHLVVIDAIEGFEVLAGELNAFGEKSTRRSRIAQTMRLMAEKCHVLLVVEESKTYERLAEEFVADTVIRLENVSTNNYERRVLKIEKVRGQSHIRGWHHYSIRSGKGSTTGHQINPDDPEVTAHRASKSDEKPVQGDTPDTERKKSLSTLAEGEKQSYVQVFHSVHRLNRRIMELKAAPREKPEKYYAAFGIKYLDNMLGGETEATERREGEGEYQGYYFDPMGLPCGSITALIGDSLTQKRSLGEAFLSRCFYSFNKRLEERRDLLKKASTEEEYEQIWQQVQEKVQLLSDSDSLGKSDTEWEKTGRDLVKDKRWEELSKHLQYRLDDKQLPFPVSSSIRDLMQYLLGDKPAHRTDVEVEEALLTHLAAWLLDYKWGLAVMLATHNTHHEKLAENFVRWLHSKTELKNLNNQIKGYERALIEYIKAGTICRRLEIHNLSSEILIHIVQQAIIASQKKILTPKEMREENLRYKKSWPIRVVIDDFSAFRDIFPEFREDPLLLPSILFHLEREGVTTLIIDTQSGRPDTPIAERFESELRKMVQHNLYTWRVPFYGESRVAITAIPPFSQEFAGIVRELRWETEILSQSIVDPHFELYTGLEEGKPKPVPLSVHFYAETPAIETYFEMENSLFNDLFVPATNTSQTTSSVIIGTPSTRYNELRDFAYMQRDTRLDHTRVFQVDEFWTVRAPKNRKRAGAFHPQWQYLSAITTHRSQEPDTDVDPYELFQPRESDADSFKNPDREVQRKHFYEEYYEDFLDHERKSFYKESTLSEKSKEELVIDRIPFTWDFGFLLCQERAWNTGRHLEVKVRIGKDKKGNDRFRVDKYTVQDVWDSLSKAQDKEPVRKPLPYVSWRIFIEACKKAAEGLSERLAKPVTAFDFAQISPESFSCLILEMWFSEIYDTLHRKMKEAQLKKENKRKTELEKECNNFLKAISKRSLFVSSPGSQTKNSPLLLSKLLEDYWLDLYKSWLILIEVINFSDIVGEATALNFDFKSKNTDFTAIASRHWYKTASQCPDEIATKEPIVAVRLPGRFSVRGDWFFAVSGSSRSIRQAERALDLLSSRRANVSRLQSGIGLPVRLLGQESSENLRTRLISHEQGQDNVKYGTFLKVGANNADCNEEFYWLWRSSLDDYAHCNRIWHKWLNRMLLSWHRDLLRYRSVWRNSFVVYDELTNYPPCTIERFAPTQAELDSIEEELNIIEAQLNRIPPGRVAEHKKKADEYEKKLNSFLAKFDSAPQPGIHRRVRSLAQLRVRADFRKLWEVLKEELKQASKANQNQ